MRNIVKGSRYEIFFNLNNPQYSLNTGGMKRCYGGIGFMIKQDLVQQLATDIQHDKLYPGRLSSVRFELGDKMFQITVVYMPIGEFAQKLCETLEVLEHLERETEKAHKANMLHIIGGDWNTALVRKVSDKRKGEIIKWIQDQALTTLNDQIIPIFRREAEKDGTIVITESIIDHIVIHYEHTENIENTWIEKLTPESDHACIGTLINYKDIPKAIPIWRWRGNWSQKEQEALTVRVAELYTVLSIDNESATAPFEEEPLTIQKLVNAITTVGREQKLYYKEEQTLVLETSNGAKKLQNKLRNARKQLSERLARGESVTKLRVKIQTLKLKLAEITTKRRKKKLKQIAKAINDLKSGAAFRLANNNK
jgi:hypothetical protein